MRKKSFLKTICPFRVLEERVTWGQFIALYIQGIMGAVGMFAFYLMFITVAEILEVVR